MTNQSKKILFGISEVLGFNRLKAPPSFSLRRGPNRAKPSKSQLL